MAGRRTWDAHQLTRQARNGQDGLTQAKAFAIASGATPQAGIVTAIIAGLLISMLGGSRVQIGGPAGAGRAGILAGAAA